MKKFRPLSPCAAPDCRRLWFEALEDRRMLTSTGSVPILHILAEIGPENYHDFHPDHDVDHYRSLLNASGSADQPQSIPAVDYSDVPVGAEGHFAGDAAFPGNDNFVLEVTAYFYVQVGQVGEWTFGVHSDDGSRLRVDGIDVITDDALHAPQDSFGSVSLTTGLHSLELVYFERTGGAALELFAAPGLHTTFNSNFTLFSNSLFALDGDISLRYRASDTLVSSLTDADALLAEPYHNVVEYFDETSGGLLQLTPATAGDLDGTADGIVGPYQFSTTITDVHQKRRMAIEAALADFNFSLYDTPAQGGDGNGVLTPDELVVVVMTGDVGANYHIGSFRTESEFIPGTIQQFNLVDPGTGLPYISERGQLPGQGGLFDYRNLYYGRPHPTQPMWTPQQAQTHFLAAGGQMGDFNAAGDGANIRGTDTAVQASGVTIPAGFAVAAVGQWRGFLTHVHEISHLLHPDALDIYNYEDTGGVQAEIHGYSVMAGTGSGSRHHDPWTKSRLGWVSPITVTTPTTVVLTDVATTGRVIKIPRPGNPQEYFLIENRWGGSSYDALSHAKTDKAGLPGPGVADEGVAIWHVDESRLPAFRANDFSAPPFLAKVDASNTPNVSNDDLFDGSADFHALTTPNSNWNDGTPSDIVITAISPPGPTVTLEIDFTGVPRDALEPNDSFEFARNLGSGDQSVGKLTIHRNNDDYFRWTAPASGTVTIDVLFDDDIGDVDASLHEDDPAHTVLGVSNSSTDNEQLSANVTAGESYLLRVYGYQGAINSDYTLVIDGTDPVGDRFELNNSFVEATALGTGDVVETGLSIHQSGDDDFFRWFAPDSGNFQVNIIFEHSAGDLDLFLYDQSFNQIAFSNSTTDDETIQIANISPLQAYYIRVVGFNGAINPTYDLGIISPDIPTDFLEPNEEFGMARPLGVGDQTQSHLTIHAPGNDDYYRWRAPASGLSKVDLEFLHEVGDLDVSIYNSNEVAIASSASATDDEHLEFNVEKGAYYYLRVYGFNGALHHDYQLVIDGPDIPADRLEANDSFGMATDLGTGDRFELDLTIHATNNDDYFQWTAPADGTLALNLYFEQSAGDLDLYLYDGPSFDDQIAYSTSNTDHEQIVYPVVGQVTYYILVDGSLGATNYDYALSLDGPEPISADFDRDGDVDGRDFLAWQRGYGTPAPSALKEDGDADNDMDVDSDDLSYWQTQYGQPAPLTAAHSITKPVATTTQSEEATVDALVAFSDETRVKALTAELVDAAMAMDLIFSPDIEAHGASPRLPQKDHFDEHRHSTQGFQSLFWQSQWEIHSHSVRGRNREINDDRFARETVIDVATSELSDESETQRWKFRGLLDYSQVR